MNVVCDYAGKSDPEYSKFKDLCIRSFGIHWMEVADEFIYTERFMRESRVRDCCFILTLDYDGPYKDPQDIPSLHAWISYSSDEIIVNRNYITFKEYMENEQAKAN